MLDSLGQVALLEGEYIILVSLKNQMGLRFSNKPKKIRNKIQNDLNPRKAPS
jgi:hypothetical protein